MGSIGFWEIVGLAVLALFIFGPERLPGIARTVGRTVSQVRNEATKTLTELKDAAGLDEDVTALAREARDLRNTLTDVKKSAAGMVLGPMNEVRDEVKAISAGGPTDRAVNAAGLVPGEAPFDPDAT